MLLLTLQKNLNSPYAYEARAGVYEAAMLIDSNTYYAKAKDDYNRAILLDPYNPDHMLGLSRLEYSKGGKESTANLIDRMISIKPNYTPAYLTLADILEVENQREKKAYVLQEAFKADRSNQNVAYLLAQEYYKLGLYSDYKQLMSDLIAINPNLPALKQQMDEALKNIPIKAENKDVVSDKNANTTKDSTNKEESSTKRK